MFNRTDFNKTTFNRPLYSIVFGKLLASGEGNIYPAPVLEAVARTLLSGFGKLELTISQQGEAIISGLGGLTGSALKELLAETLLSGIGNIYSSAHKYEVKAITFTGNFAVNDTIVIDMDNFTVKLNGINAMNNITGNFFNLLEGENEITYTDSSSNRTVRMTVVYRDRWV